MATIQGPGGGFTTITGFNGKIDGWTADTDYGIVDTTGFTDNGNPTFEATKVDITGAATGVATFDASTTAPTPSGLASSTPTMSSTKGSITLTFTTGCTWAFPAIITGLSMSRPNKDGRADVSFRFRKNGALTQTWDETT